MPVYVLPVWIFCFTPCSVWDIMDFLGFGTLGWKCTVRLRVRLAFLFSFVHGLVLLGFRGV